MMTIRTACGLMFTIILLLTVTLAACGGESLAPDESADRRDSARARETPDAEDATPVLSIPGQPAVTPTATHPPFGRPSSAPTPTPIPSSTPLPAVSATPTPSAPGILEPEGYYHGIDHGLAVAQTSRSPSASREGWVDITLSMMAVKFGGGMLQVESGESNSLCFGPGDCFLVQWGSEEQFEAEMSIPARWREDTGAPGSRGPKAASLDVTFQVAGNADNANLYFGDHKIPLNLQGDSVVSGDHGPLLPVPTPPQSQDARTANFFVDTDHGVAVTSVHRELTPVASFVRVELEVLPLGDTAAPESLVSIGDGAGGVCFGADGSECLEIFWGPKNQFNAMLSLERVFGNNRHGDLGTYTEGRRSGGRWPLGLRVWFRTPNNQDSAVLYFGEHSIPIDMRGMTGDSAYDYTAHYPEARPGSALYESERKTVVLDSVKQDPDTGDLELTLTARNDSESKDFTPVINSAIFSATGIVDVTAGNRTVTGDTLAPGQSESLTAGIPRDGGYAYSSEPARRPDGAVLHVGEAGGAAGAQQGSMPGFVRFERTADEGKFWPVKRLWTYEIPPYRSSKFSRSANYWEVDGTVYVHHQLPYGYWVMRALDPATGGLLWERGHLGSIIGAADGLMVAEFGAFDPASGNAIWETDPTCAPVNSLHDGVAYGIASSYYGQESRQICAMDAATGSILWSVEESMEGDIGFWFSEDGAPYLYNTYNDGNLYGSPPCIRLWALADVPVTSVGEPNLQHCDHGDEWADLVEVADGMAYLSTSLLGLAALDAATGDLQWAFSAPRCCSDSSSGFRGLVADGVLYGYHYSNRLFSFDGGHFVAALDAATGGERWRYDLEGQANSKQFEAVGLADGTLYISLWGNLIALEAATGKERWRREAPGGSYTLKDGVVYASHENGLFALDAVSGSQLWGVDGTFGNIFAGVGDNVVYVLRETTSQTANNRYDVWVTNYLSAIQTGPD